MLLCGKYDCNDSKLSGIGSAPVKSFVTAYLVSQGTQQSTRVILQSITTKESEVNMHVRLILHIATPCTVGSQIIVHPDVSGVS